MLQAHLVENLQSVADELLRLTEGTGIPSWPSVPAQLPSLLWPRPDDIPGFLDVASGISPSLIYLSEVAVADLDQVAFDVTIPVVDNIVQITCGFVVNGLLHHVTYSSASVQEELQVQEHTAAVERDDEERRVEQMAREVFSDPAFHDHGSAGRDDRTRAVVRAAFPELSERLVQRVAWRGQELDRVEAQPEREAAMAAEGHERYDSGETKVAIATSMGVSVNVLSRVMQQNPPQ